VAAKFYCTHALADSNQCIQIREKTLELSSIVLATLSTLSSFRTLQRNARYFQGFNFLKKKSNKS